MDLVLHVRQRSSLQQLLHHVIEADRQLSKLHHYLVKLQDLSQSLNDIDAASAIPLIDESIRFLHQAVFVVSIRKLQYFTELQRNLRAYHQQWDDIPDVDLHDLWQCWHTHKLRCVTSFCWGWCEFPAVLELYAFHRSTQIQRLQLVCLFGLGDHSSLKSENVWVVFSLLLLGLLNAN